MREGNILVTEGTLVTEKYASKISVYVQKSFYCPDIFIEHTIGEPMTWDLCDSKEFAQGVIDVLIDNGCIEPDHKYEFSRAELGMQEKNCVAYEGLRKDGEDYSKIFSIKYGAVDQGAMEDAERKAEEDAILDSNDHDAIYTLAMKHLHRDKTMLEKLAKNILTMKSQKELVEIIAGKKQLFSMMSGEGLAYELAHDFYKSYDVEELKKLFIHLRNTKY